MKHRLFCLWLLLSAAVGLSAYDFQSGDLFYNFTSDSTVEVTSQVFNDPNNYVGLTSANIPASIEYAGKNYSVTSIEYGAFMYCSGLTSISIPNSVTSIGVQAFCCSGLVSITIPISVTSIGVPIVNGCTGLTSIIIESENSIFDSRDNCSAIIETATNTLIAGCKTTTIPNSVTSIGEYAFLGCSGLTSITIPNSVTSIRNYAFYGCRGLTSITIPNSVTNIGEYAFNDIFNIVYSGTVTGAPWGARSMNGYIDDYLVYSDSTKTILLTCNSTAKGTITIPNSVTSIGESAFSGCTGLTSITIPNSVTSIGNRAFNGVFNVVYSGTATGAPWGALSMNGYIDGYLVYSDSTKTTLLICNSTAKGTIIIPNSVTSIRNYAFYGCRGLTSITIPNSITSIGYSAFDGCSGLTSITIPNSVTSIGGHAFSGCSGLTSITIPNSVTSIGEYAFCDCRGLTSITIPNGVTSIGGGAFRGCSGLTSITIPDGVTSIGDEAFLYSGLTSVIWNAKNYPDCNKDNTPFYCIYYNHMDLRSQITSFVFGDSVEHIPAYLCYGMDSITSITIPNSVASIGDNAFYGLSSITKIELPGTITSIGESAFANCSKLSSVYLPATLNTIGANAFAGCRKLYDIYCYAAEPPVADNSSFANYNVNLYVPCDNLRDYQMDAVFGSFKYIQCMGAENTNTSDSITITPSTNAAVFIWRADETADTYTLQITKDDEVFCTLVFNANGQLCSIAFAPSRNGRPVARAAEQTATGFRFTVTGLSKKTHYAFEMKVKDKNDQLIQTYTGEFDTTSDTPSSIDNATSAQDSVSKVVRNGQVLIIRGGKTYTATGVEVR